MTDSTSGDSTTEIQPRKPCCLNWEYQEVVALIATKRGRILGRARLNAPIRFIQNCSCEMAKNYQCYQQG